MRERTRTGFPEVKLVKNGYNFGIIKNDEDEDRGIDIVCWKDIDNGRQIVFAKNVSERHCLEDNINEDNILTTERIEEAIELCDKEIRKEEQKND